MKAPPSELLSHAERRSNAGHFVNSDSGRSEPTPLFPWERSQTSVDSWPSSRLPNSGLSALTFLCHSQVDTHVDEMVVLALREERKMSPVSYIL